MGWTYPWTYRHTGHSLVVPWSLLTHDRQDLVPHMITGGCPSFCTFAAPWQSSHKECNDVKVVFHILLIKWRVCYGSVLVLQACLQSVVDMDDILTDFSCSLSALAIQSKWARTSLSTTMRSEEVPEKKGRWFCIRFFWEKDVGKK